MRGENTMTPVFELKNVNYYYDHKKVLENINIKINKGEFLAIVGPNGAGKSTLLKLILGLLPLQSGEIFVEGIDFKNKKMYHKKQMPLIQVSQQVLKKLF